MTLLGRPNAGKSTLLNRFVGRHLSIVTAKAQTTWRRVTGILTIDSDQLVFLDTPGLLDARDLLQRAMLGAALEAVAEADVLVLVVDGTDMPGARETEPMVRALEGASAPLHVALNKADAAREDTLPAWERWALELPATPHRVSALAGEGTDVLRDAVRKDLPRGPFLFPPDEIAAESVRFFVAELVRETIFERYRQEVPYATFCQVEEFREDQRPVYIHVNVYVERKSQKGILIGRGGEAIRSLGEAARAKIEHFIGTDVYLDLWVKPLEAWRKNRTHLGRLGFRVPADDETRS